MNLYQSISMFEYFTRLEYSSKANIGEFFIFCLYFSNSIPHSEAWETDKVWYNKTRVWKTLREKEQSEKEVCRS